MLKEIKVPTDGHWSQIYTTSLIAKNKETLFYFVVSNCENLIPESVGRNGPLKLDVEMEILNDKEN